ncbi:MAG: hypothetical protein AB2L09_00105 [Coriobacteriia bacterium]
MDIVICAETLDSAFARRIWEFVEIGDYSARERSGGQRELYRFHKPQKPGFPFMIELFSRLPDVIDVPPGCHLTPIPIADEVSSLSAILLNDDYYWLVQRGTKDQSGFSVLQPAYILPLKARAWLDLTAKRKAGASIPARDIKKHRTDILRLAQLVSPGSRIPVSKAIREDLDEFAEVGLFDGCSPADINVPMTLDQVKTIIASVYENG